SWSPSPTLASLADDLAARLRAAGAPPAPRRVEGPGPGDSVRRVDYRLLGRTGLRARPLIRGHQNFAVRGADKGVQTDEDEAFRIMDRGLELGLNFFDTANVYGDGRGLTESIVGRWFAQGDRRRERVVLATKVYNTRSAWPNEGRL